MQRTKLMTLSLALGLLVAPLSLATAQETETPHSPVVPRVTPRITLQDSVRTEVLAQLKGYHEPPSREKLLAITPHAREYLLEIAGQESLFPLQRYHAIDALGSFWPDESTLALYHELAGRVTTSEATLHRVLLLGVEHFGDRAMPFVLPHLDHESQAVRMTVIHALGEMKTRAAREVLEERVEKERDPVVRAALGRALGPVLR